MNNCVSCDVKYDHTDKTNLVSRGMFTNVSKCPNCGCLHRTDYVSSFVILVSLGIVIFGIYLSIELGSVNLYKHEKELFIVALGVAGVFYGFKFTKLVAYKKT